MSENPYKTAKGLIISKGDALELDIPIEGMSMGVTVLEFYESLFAYRDHRTNMVHWETVDTLDHFRNMEAE